MIWVVGAGEMAREYVKVLIALGTEIIVIGRSEPRVKEVRESFGVKCISGGLEAFLDSSPIRPEGVIVCVPVDKLSTTAESLLGYGVDNILLEKPGALSGKQLVKIKHLAEKTNSKVGIGYNRRFFQSVLAAEKMIAQDGGATAISIEITEWGWRVAEDPSSSLAKSRWMNANTSHMLDLGFFIGGLPSKISSYRTGVLHWHPTGSRFAGSGVTVRDILFTYMGCWDGPGRWSVEIITNENRYIFKPAEYLYIQRKGSLETIKCPDIDYSLDEEFKPGLFLQTKSFLDGDWSRICSLEFQCEAINHYSNIAGYH
jgi:predicted dehydrogenase